jgi:UDP-N-acetylglucosamine--N-acetylmuramyl-(pentapeptide) pyrophosphoryl-undecaprenol N-acetylglucosamine transferase
VKSEVRILLAGGGTGGHVFPAIYIAEYLKKYWGAQCEFIGTTKGIENIKVPQAGFVVRHIWISGLQRSLDWHNLLFPFKVMVSLIQSRRELIRFKPDLVIGTGGYVSGPVLYQAIKMKIPTVLQEQNSYPGITTRLLASRVDCVFVAYQEALHYLKKIKKYVLVGNPIKITIASQDMEEALKYFNIKKGVATILVFGGSQGARSINRAIDNLIESGMFEKVQLIWQTGSSEFDFYKKKYIQQNNRNLRIMSFIDRMDYAYTVANFAICRAGAMTISELAAAGVPAILIPYPFAAENHQFKNAQTIAKNEGAVLIEETSDLTGSLETAVHSLLQAPERLSYMSEQIRHFHHPDTLQRMATELEDLIHEKNEIKNLPKGL